MGKRKAMKLTSIKVSDQLNSTFAREIDGLNQMVENLQTLLRRETDKNAKLEAELKTFSSKTNAKKASKKKTAVSEAETEKE